MSHVTLEKMNPGASPWGGYFAYADGTEVGECAFKSAPADGRVEIAYHTFEGFENRGLGTQMARTLVDIARNATPGLVIVAQTLRETNASTKILERVGFTCRGVVHHPEDGEVLEWLLYPDAPSNSLP